MGTQRVDPDTGARRPALLAWGELHRRALPWRQTRDPCAIHVSEVMLQQTQADRVIGRWERFMATYPDVATCAAAPRGDIIAAWVGLGYNRRAVFLHRAAAVVAVDYGGRYPQELPALRALPGVGDYTARAIACFAFGQDVGVLDTNVGRVLARWHNETLGRSAGQRLADDAVPPGQGWAWNQSMFDLGAGICHRRNPDCGSCPVAASCRWFRAGRPDPDPANASAGVSQGQSRFDGSDRQGRGRLVAALATGPMSTETVAATMGWPQDPDRARRVLEGLVRDGLVVIGDDTVALSGEATATER